MVQEIKILGSSTEISYTLFTTYFQQFKMMIIALIPTA